MVGRQIDALCTRQVGFGELLMDPEARHRIGSDHAVLKASATLIVKRRAWPIDSRPRFVCVDLPSDPLVEAADVAELAKTCTKPRASTCYSDPQIVLQAVGQAKQFNDKRDWKRVHKLRRAARREWEEDQISRILQGDWLAYRARKQQCSANRDGGVECWKIAQRLSSLRRRTSTSPKRCCDLNRKLDRASWIGL